MDELGQGNTLGKVVQQDQVRAETNGSSQVHSVPPEDRPHGSLRLESIMNKGVRHKKPARLLQRSGGLPMNLLRLRDTSLEIPGSMEQGSFSFSYGFCPDASQLDPADGALLRLAAESAAAAYAPYSRFRVGAAGRLRGGALVTGSNQENASYPAGICAERVLLSASASMHAGVPIETIAVTYLPAQGAGDHPVAPCGICRQSLLEYEKFFGRPIRLILGGTRGKVLIIPSASLLLPLAFTPEDLE